jgi:hypothetical protein
VADQYVVYEGRRKRDASQPVRIVGSDGTAFHLFAEADAPTGDLPRGQFLDALADALSRAGLPSFKP